MATEGDDLRLSRMLLDVAQEFEDEADLMEAMTRPVAPIRHDGDNRADAQGSPPAQDGEASLPARNSADSKASSPLSFVEIGRRSNASSA
jgi:hypothetical protein